MRRLLTLPYLVGAGLFGAAMGVRQYHAKFNEQHDAQGVKKPVISESPDWEKYYHFKRSVLRSGYNDKKLTSDQIKMEAVQSVENQDAVMLNHLAIEFPDIVNTAFINNACEKICQYKPLGPFFFSLQELAKSGNVSPAIQTFISLNFESGLIKVANPELDRVYIDTLKEMVNLNPEKRMLLVLCEDEYDAFVIMEVSSQAGDLIAKPYNFKSFLTQSQCRLIQDAGLYESMPSKFKMQKETLFGNRTAFFRSVLDIVTEPYDRKAHNINCYAKHLSADDARVLARFAIDHGNACSLNALAKAFPGIIDNKFVDAFYKEGCSDAQRFEDAMLKLQNEKRLAVSLVR